MSRKNVGNQIYELAFLTKGQAQTGKVEQVVETITKTLQEFEGEVLSQKDWGQRTFSEPNCHKNPNGHFYYLVFTAQPTAIQELDRKLRIDETVLKKLVTKLGPVSKKDAVLEEANVEANPFVSKFKDVKEEGEALKDQKFHSKKKKCWFKAKKITPDWKCPHTYTWLVNEFGKIIPTRVTGVSSYKQRQAALAIKRARFMGILSIFSNKVAY